MGISVTKKHFADMLGKYPQYVTNLINDGMPSVGGGVKGQAVEIDTEEAINWLIKREIIKHIDDVDDERYDGNVDDEDRLLKRRRREKLELETDILKKRYIPIEVVESIFFRFFNSIRTQLSALPSRNANDLARINDPAKIREKQRIEIHRISTEAAEKFAMEIQELTDDLDKIIEEDGEVDCSTATSDGG